MTYIPGALGKFLDDLRRDLVPGYEPHAHVTMLPPRPLPGTAEQAKLQIDEYARQVTDFELQMSSAAVFPLTNVIYLEIGKGRDRLLGIHSDLNRDALDFHEPFPYHPHVTLAQELTAEVVEEAYEEARRRWAEFAGPRSMVVRELTFVQNTYANKWRDLASVQLQAATKTELKSRAG